MVKVRPIGTAAKAKNAKTLSHKESYLHQPERDEDSQPANHVTRSRADRAPLRNWHGRELDCDLTIID
jgi:hypothetical protein